MSKVRLIIIGGFAGAGKTTLTKRLSAEHNLPLVSTDELNTALRESLGWDFHQASPIAYEIAWSVIRSYLKNGVTVIFDAHMCNERLWQNVDLVREQTPHVEILPLILTCSLETHKKRIEDRGKNQPEHLNLGGDVLEDVLFKYEFLKNLERQDLIRIDAEGTPDEVYAAVMKRIHIV